MAGELVTAAQLNTHIRDNENYLFSALYPVGSIFISTSATNPASLLGFGTWAAFGAGRTLIGLDGTQTEFDTVEETGGAKTLTGANTFGRVSDGTFVDLNAATGLYDIHTKSVGGGGSPGLSSAVVNGAAGLPPYVVVYMWKRVS